MLFSWYYKNHLEETSFLFPSKHLLLGPPKTGSFFQSIPDRARKYCYLAKNGRLNSKFWPIELWADSHSMAVLWCFFPLLNIKHIEAMIIFPWNHQQPKNRQHFQSIPDWVRKYCQQINGRSIFVWILATKMHLNFPPGFFFQWYHSVDLYPLNTFFLSVRFFPYPFCERLFVCCKCVFFQSCTSSLLYLLPPFSLSYALEQWTRRGSRIFFELTR